MNIETCNDEIIDDIYINDNLYSDDINFPHTILIADPVNIIIGKNVSHIHPDGLVYYSDIRSLTVSEENDYFKAIDNVLYSIGGDNLIFCPNNAASGSFTIPHGVEVIGPYSFKNCTNLYEAFIEGSVSNIREYAFAGCYNLVTIHLGNQYNQGNSIYLDPKIFLDCDSLSEVFVNCTLECNQNYGEDRPFSDIYRAFDLVFSENVDTIDCFIFNNCLGLERVEIGNNITSIGEYAFAGCHNLEYVKIGCEYRYGDILSIRECAFANCYNLKEVKIYRDIFYTSCNGIGAFSQYDNTNCSKMDVVIGDNVSSIVGSLFKNLTNLRSIEICKGVKYISGPTFMECELEIIRYRGSLSDWCKIYFTECESNPMMYSDQFFLVSEYGWEYSIGYLEIPSDVKMIGNYQFTGLKTLEALIIPDSVEHIGVGSFKCCPKLDYILFGEFDSDESTPTMTISHNSFEDCASLRQVYVNANMYIDTDDQECGISPLIGNTIEAPFKGSGLNTESYARVDISDKVTVIGGSLFSEFAGLKNVQLGSGLKHIEYSVFEGCFNIEDIDLPRNVTHIGPYAFNLCSITSLFLHNNILSFETQICISDNVEIFYEGTAEMWKNVNTDVVDGVICNCTKEMYDEYRNS